MASEELIGVSTIEDELLDSSLTLEELSDDGEEIRGTPAEIGGSFELLLIFAADEESASSTELLRCSWLSGISITEELDVSVVLPVLSGSTGLMGAPDSASLRHPLKNTEVMPSNEATLIFVALDNCEFPVTFFFSIFIKVFLLTSFGALLKNLDPSTHYIIYSYLEYKM